MLYNNRVHIITTEARRTPRKKSSDFSVHMYIDTYVQRLDIGIATEGPETACAEKNSVRGLSDWLKIRLKQSKAKIDEIDKSRGIYTWPVPSQKQVRREAGQRQGSWW